MKRSFRVLLASLVLAACREVQHDSDPTSEDQADAAAVSTGSENDASGAQEASAPNAADSALSAAGEAGTVASTLIDWFDGGDLLPLTPDHEGAWPPPNRVDVPTIDAGSDPGCKSTVVTNERGVGGNCRYYARSVACPATHTCTEALALRGLNMASPYYCSRPCLEDAHCGRGASCCSVPGLEDNACIMDGCRYSCRKSP